MPKAFLFPTMLCCILMITPAFGNADSITDLVKKGNAAYLAGKYDEALLAYDEASVEAPESPHIYYNKGATLYQKGDYSSAAAAFEKAALKTKEVPLEAKSKFNLGNCAFREAERQQDSDLNKALEACTKSIRHYQDALALDSGFVEAAENIEVVRLVMKAILDKINKQKEAAQQRQEAMQRFAEQLKELIKEQQNALSQNEQLEDERRRNGDSHNLREKIQDLANGQKDLQEKTEALAKNLPKSSGQNNSATEKPAEKHLNNATKEQRAASGNLEKYHTAEARTNQEKALGELKKALSSLSENKKSGGQQKNQHRQEGEEQKQEQASSTGKPPQEQKDQKENQAAVAQHSDAAQEILDEEKKNKRQRRMQASGSYRDVDKDW